MKRILATALMALALQGCAIGPDRSDQSALSRQRAVELGRTPFFPQEQYQCGPAALATVLSASGVGIAPRALTPQVYLPGERGSLQTELVAASRRHHRIPYRLEPSLRAVLDELNAGRPVLVFQNLALDAWPVWHFAVVVGYDPHDDEWILRSGTEARKRQSTSLFLRTWQRGERWAMVVLRPGDLPADNRPLHYLEAVAGFEQVTTDAQAGAVDRAYAAALARWPEQALVHFAVANRAYATGHAEKAQRHYQQALRLEPGNAVVRNNYAVLLSEHGCTDAARRQVRKALANIDVSNPLYATLQDTHRRLADEAARGRTCSLGASAAGSPDER